MGITDRYPVVDALFWRSLGIFQDKDLSLFEQWVDSVVGVNWSHQNGKPPLQAALTPRIVGAVKMFLKGVLTLT